MSRPALRNDWGERKRRAAVVAAHRAEYGDWCPGWQRPAHPSTDLTADHLLAVAAGGDEGGSLAVLCRSCNGSKQDGKRRDPILLDVRSRDW
jgi:5-methylcytosine-specific restriction protein A